MYENLATKYRPKTFDEVIGQDSVVRTLANALKLSRIAHAYLFFGPRGCGKTTVVRILAKSLNCHHPKEGIPCNKCVSCTEISQSRSLDVLEIDAASNTQVDKVREVIIENVNLVPSRDKYKIYILDEVHMLSTSSFNALLKTIEEPPTHVVFMMATTELSKVPTTIVSRCQAFRFKLIPEKLIIEKLEAIVAKEKIKVESDSIKLIARVCGGAMRDAITVLDRAVSFSNGNIDINSLKELLGFARDDLIKEIANAMLHRNLKSMHAGFEKIGREGYDVLLILRDLRDIFAETFLHLQGFSQSENVLKDTKENPFIFAKLARKLNKIIEEVKSSDLQLISAEMALFTLMESQGDIEAIIRKIEVLEQRLRETSKTQSSVPDNHSMPGSGSANAVQESPENYQTKSHPVGQSDDRTQPENPSNQKQSSASSVRNKSNEIHPVKSPDVTSGVSPDADNFNGVNSVLWKKILDAIGSKRPLLYNIIISSKVTFVDDRTWKFYFVNKFHAQTAEKYKKDIESIIEKFSGSKITIHLEHKDTRHVSSGPDDDNSAVREPVEGSVDKTNVNDSGKETENHKTESLQWMDLNSEDSDVRDPEIKKLAKIFHGKIKKINKIK